MIAVSVDLDSRECMTGITVTGHAGIGKRGNDPLCAAVSILTRTLLTSLHASGTVTIYNEHSEEGMLRAELTIGEHADIPYISGLTAFFLTGVFELQNDFPHAIMINLHTKDSEETDGT